MFVGTFHRKPYALKSCLVASVVGLALALSAFAGGAQANSNGSPAAAVDDGATGPTASSCQASLPALQRSAFGEQFGHLQALKTLERCDTLLGQNRAATFAGWLIDRQLDRPDPHDE
jgi:hypothetical protein